MGGAPAGRRSLVASRYPALAQTLGDRAGTAGEPTIHDAATAAVEHKGSGATVDAGVAARVGAHLGADFSGVRVHSDPLAQQATAAMGARAFAYGSDVFLGPGESGGDVGLMAHELTHVAQQGAAGQRAVQRAVQVGDADSPAEREADQVSAAVTGGQGRPASLLIDDGPVGPEQMLKSQFLEQLRAQVTAAADGELGPIYSAIGCPYIEQYFNRYTNQPAAASEVLLRRFAPATRTARTAADMIPAVVARVREGVRQWRDTGQAPPDVAAMTPDAAAGGGGGPGAAQAQALRAPDGRETLASLEAELGPGRPLDGATASRMSDALGVDVSSARIHTGQVAARKAADAGALAFAVGPNVVMGAGAPGAGTIEGDALLAHELAHTAQQAGAAADPAARLQPIGAEAASAESDADEASVSGMARLWGGATDLVRRAATALKTGLQLQRCKSDETKTAATKGYEPSGSAASGGKDLMAGTGAVSETEQQGIDKILNPAGGGGAAPLPFIKKDFEQDMIKALDGWRTGMTRGDKQLKGKDAYKLDMPQVRKTGEAAQQVVTARFGELVSGATFNAGTNARKAGYDVGSPSVLHEQKETVDGVPTSDHPDIALGLVTYATNQTNGGKPVMDAHHVDRSRVDDQAAYDKVVQNYAKKHQKELLEIQRNWPGEEHPWDGTIYIRLENMKDPDLTKKEKSGAAKLADANLRSGYWGTFQTLIHEYLHACAHHELQTAANTDRGLTHQILIEGGCDYFTEKVWLAIEPTLAGDDALREKVEGKPYPYAAEVIPAPSYYDEKEDVKKIIAELGSKGEANFTAAYFMGHVELIGLSHWKKGMDKDQDVFIAPVDNFTLAEVAKRCNVTEESVATANSLAIGDQVAKDTRLTVKGVRHHIAIDGDTLADIAKQHGVTEASVKQANPFMPAPYAGADFLVPVH